MLITESQFTKIIDNNRQMLKKGSDTSDTSDKWLNGLVISYITTDRLRTKGCFVSEAVRSAFFVFRAGSDRFGRCFGQCLKVNELIFKYLLFVRSCPYLKSRFINSSAKKCLFTWLMFEHRLWFLSFRLSR